MAKVIGLTGGIGSGKTTVARQFEALGIPVYIADDAGRFVMQQRETVDVIRQKFGDKVLDGNQVDRAALAALVFNDAALLQQLNDIIHPLVRLHFQQWLELNQHFRYVIKEAAILFESGSYKECDKIITVVADLETRISRVVTRDGIDREAVLKRIGSQWSDAQRIALSDYIIYNDDHDETSRQIRELHTKLMNIQ